MTNTSVTDAMVDLRTHKDVWRKALVVARDAAIVMPPDIDDRSYWEHEIVAYDRMQSALSSPQVESGEIAKLIARLRAHLDRYNLVTIDAEDISLIDREHARLVAENERVFKRNRFLTAQLTAAQERERKMREALEPFAGMVEDNYVKAMKDGEPFYQDGGSLLTAGDFRRAATAIEDGQDE